ncbi:MAG: hypothetical protein A3J93_04920 [Candidatus Magasanikbacteria bacterium RIFOXYC2_FULL_42_28]|uniref:ABC transporter domain-containing protein n=1 Tax=Candidatus Magasanikbacteria bacterium RIFOXYC2_FULL_42_28 TaxID=1798704 RepID=A0A1F6NWR4_9BACT|nr:MAG: hypothetical protein A3J93_04920 [Candidatus Magasanikbacteria bacterium RIFOXYC2_FULL_42_28]
MSLIQIQNVNKLYTGAIKQDENYALDMVNFDIKPGEFFCVLGPSGCGKTTLLNIMAGFEKPTNGKIIINGSEVTGPSPKNIVVFQEYGLFPWKTVEKNIEFPLNLNKTNEETKSKIIKEILELVNLSDFANKTPAELSGGMKQRVALARALVVQPEILFMDEPFAALDEMTRIKLERELLKIWKGRKITVVFVTHNIDSAITLGDRIAVMTPCPGKIKNILDVNLKRPRDITSNEFENLKKEILVEFDIQ